MQNNNDSVKDEARTEVKQAVEEWFTNVSLDDLFAVKGWKAPEGGQ